MNRTDGNSAGHLRIVLTCVIAALTAASVCAQGTSVLETILSAAGGGDAPFPVQNHRLTIGEFFDVLASPEVLGLNVVLRDGVQKSSVIPTGLEGLSCRDALELVLSLEGLEVVPFKRGRIYIVQRIGAKPVSATVEHRTFRLMHTTPERVIAYIRANPDAAAHVDPDRIAPDPAGGAIIVVDSPQALDELGAVVKTIDVPTATRMTTIDLGNLTKGDLEAALHTAGLDAAGPGSGVKIAVLHDGHTALVAGTPEQLEQVRGLVRTMDVQPEQVQIGVSIGQSVTDVNHARGIDTGPLAISVPRGGSARIGGRIVFQDSSTSATNAQTVWVTGLSGYPARIGLNQIFNVPMATVISAPGAGVGVVTSVREVPVGLSLEVTPHVAGSIVVLDVRLVDETPTQVTDLGVNRSGITLATGVSVPRGGSISLGGLGSALTSSGHSGLLGLLSTRSRRVQDTQLTIRVR